MIVLCSRSSCEIVVLAVRVDKVRTGSSSLTDLVLSSGQSASKNQIPWRRELGLRLNAAYK